MAEQNGDRFVTYKTFINWIFMSIGGGLTILGLFLTYNYFMLTNLDKKFDTKADVAKTAAICDDINEIKSQSQKNGESIDELKLGLARMEMLLRQFAATHPTAREREDPFNPFYQGKKK